MCNKIIDFPCSYTNSSGVRAEVTEELDLSFPDAQNTSPYRFALKFCKFNSQEFLKFTIEKLSPPNFVLSDSEAEI